MSRILATALFLLWAWPQQPVLAAGFDVRTASVRLTDGEWRLTARIDYRLSDEASDALTNGVRLHFRVETFISRARRWLPDEQLVESQVNWQLSYEPLSERYLVQYPDDREATSHASLFGALNAIGHVQDLAIAEAADTASDDVYEVAVRAVLNQQTLPAPLQIFAFWDGGFRLESEWYEWTLQP